MSLLFYVSGAVAFAMAWAIGAQDVSNALGTSVGSKALTVRQAIVVGAVCEFVGSLCGGEVAATISGGILNMDQFTALGNDGISLYAVCMFCTMAGAFVWLAIATYYSLPVSTTHSLVGALIGVGTAAMSFDGVRWSKVGAIVSSWLTSPLLGGVISYTIFKSIHSGILTQPNPLEAARQRVPTFVSVTMGVLVTFFFLVGPASMRFPLFQAIGMGCVGAVATAAIQTQTRTRKDDGDALPLATTDDKAASLAHAEREFKFLMVVTACVVSFAHGSNDVSNSIGPFNAIAEITRNGKIDTAAPIPHWVLIGGGVGIVVGLATYGYKVMATVGEKIAKLTFSRGYAAQIGTAFTVLTATQAGLSVSTTHCLIGAISGVALVEGSDKLNTGTLKRIVMSWLVTIPAAAVAALAWFAILHPFTASLVCIETPSHTDGPVPQQL